LFFLFPGQSTVQSKRNIQPGIKMSLAVTEVGAISLCGPVQCIRSSLVALFVDLCLLSFFVDVVLQTFSKRMCAKVDAREEENNRLQREAEQREKLIAHMQVQLACQTQLVQQMQAQQQQQQPLPVNRSLQLDGLASQNAMLTA
jgi:hypothetical protein